LRLCIHTIGCVLPDTIRSE